MSVLDLLPPGTLVPRGLQELLTGLVPNAAGDTAIVQGNPAVPGLFGATLRSNASIPFTLTASPDGSFVLALNLAGLMAELPGVVAATRTTNGAGALARVRYTPAGPASVRLDGDVVITGAPGATASLTPGPELTVTLVPSTVLLPSGFGLGVRTPITVRNGELYLADLEFALPASVPALGGLGVGAALTVGRTGTRLDVPVRLPSGETGPDVSGSLSWQLPTGATLGDLAPTGGTVALDLPGGDTPLPYTPVAMGPAIKRRLRLRVGLSRSPGDVADFRFTVTAESDSSDDASDGLLGSQSDDAGDIAAGITASFAPAIAAATGAPSGATAALLFSAAARLGSHLAESGGYTLHAVTFDAGTEASDQGATTLRASLDISGSVAVKRIEIDPITISMNPRRPMRVRWRNVRASLDSAPGSAVILDFSRARPEVVDPGGWEISSPLSLLDIVGTRSGAGSTWFEVDLRFALDLGPLKISGASVRATFDGTGAPEVGIRGLKASIDVPGMIKGTGQFAFGDEPGGSGFSILVGATIVPLGLGALATFSTGEVEGVRRTQLGFGLDLPAPIPLGPTGLGLYSVLGAFGANAAMPALGETDPMLDLRRWKPWDPLTTSRDNVTVGAGLVLGTAVDNGFAFSSLGVFGVTAPDLALRIGLDAQLMGNRFTFGQVSEIATRANDPPPGLNFFGGLSATDTHFDVGINGNYKIPYIVEMHVPVAAHYPFNDPVRWWIRAGSDDGVNGFHPVVRRSPGPMEADVLPDTPFSSGGWAFLMMHGDGIENLMGRGKTYPGFAVAVGLGFSKVLGVRGVLWAEISVGLAAAIATKPRLLWALGEVSGQLGIGPFRVGLDATLELQIGPGDRIGYKIEVCGEVDLWFDTLRECIRIDNPATQEDIPDPVDDDWPFPTVTLADGLGRSLTAPGDDPEQHTPVESTEQTLTEAEWATTPTVWPDVIPLLDFPIAPKCAAGVQQPPAFAHQGVVSSGRISYAWTLLRVTFDKVAANGALTPVKAKLPTAWQQPPGVPHSNQQISTSRQLALLTANHGVSFAHLADGGASQKDGFKPAHYVGGLCEWRPNVGRGWSLGGDATGSPTAWHAPTEDRPFMIAPVLASFSSGTGFTATSKVEPSGQGLAQREGPHALTEMADAGGREFSHALRLAGARAGQRDRSTVTHRIVFDEAIVEGDLYLRVDEPGRSLGDVGEGLGASITPSTGPDIPSSIQLEGDGIVRVPLELANQQPMIGVTIHGDWLMAVSILGLHAQTVADVEAAKGTKKATGDAAAAQHKGERAMLEAAARYRIGVEMTWTRTVTNDDGSTEHTPAPASRTKYWYISTAGEKGGVGNGPGTTKPVDTWKTALAMPNIREAFLWADQFRPDYLVRYLKGYTPDDHAQHVFTSDQPEARFHAGHVDELAAAFGRDLGLLLHRTDRQNSKPKYGGVVALSFDKPLDPFGKLVQATSTVTGCGVPPTGSALTLAARLQPNAHYELSVAVPKKGEQPVKGTPELPGVTFSTSSYTGPRTLVEAFGFVGATWGPRYLGSHTTGDLPVNAISRPAGLEIDDSEFERVVADLGLPPLRPVDTPRSSTLWVKEAGDDWSVLGLLLESTEPLSRDKGERMGMRQAWLGGVELPVRRMNRSGTLVAWFATTPIPVTAPTQLKVLFNDRSTWLYRRVLVGSEPRFRRGSVHGARTP